MVNEPSVTYVVDVLLHVTNETSKSTSTSELMPVPVGGKKGTMVVVPVESTLINRISSIKLFLPKDLRSPDERKSVLKKIEQVGNQGFFGRFRKNSTCLKHQN